MATTTQERQQAFIQNYRSIVEQLARQYGFQPFAKLQSRLLNDGMIQAEAVIGVQEVPGWQPPPEAEKKEQSDQPTEAIPTATVNK